MPSIRSRPGWWHTTMTSGWLPCSKAKRNAGIGGMEQRTLSLDHIPVLRGRIRTEHFRSARLEIRDHRIHRNAAARDHDAGLSGRAKIGVHAALGKRARKREGGVFLAECAIGADREQALAGALARPMHMGILRGGVRTSISRRPRRSAALFNCGVSLSLACMPLMMSRPDSSASISEGIQLSPITPPTLATPITSARAPRARASLGDNRGSPVVTVAPSHDHSPTQRSRAQSRSPNAVLA